MARIRVPVEAFILALYPISLDPAGQPERRPRRTSSLETPGRDADRDTEVRRELDFPARMESLDQGLALPSFWSRHDITQAFSEANRIWLREAQIEFHPINITERSETVPSDEHGMWAHFVNHLPPRRGIGVGFVYDLPSGEGGWGGGRVALVSGHKVAEGIPGFAGSLLAHELGHVLIDDPLHAMAEDDPSNLMYGRRNPRVANAGLLTQRQIDSARVRALSLS